MLFGMVKNYLVRSVELVLFFFFTTAFTFRSEEKIFSNPDVIVNVVQEYGGLTVSVKSSKNINVHFYMFTVDGRLIKERKYPSPPFTHPMQLALS